MRSFDLTVRPDTYWPDAPSVADLLSSISGEARRAIVTRDPALAVDSGDWMLEPTLDDQLRSWWGSIHPSFMGGEYLDPLLPGEVEIARISLASTTADQISVRARPEDGHIAYRVVDEYQTAYECAHRSTEPLSLGELIALLDGTDHPHEEFSGGGLVKAHWQHVADFAEPRNRAREVAAFVTVSSAIYGELTSYYEHARQDWLADYPDDQDTAAEDAPTADDAE